MKTGFFRIERYELKYTIPFHMVGPISDFVSIYCSPDAYSEGSDGGFYRVNNLYFDTPNFLFLKKRLDDSDNRFNMRIRTYGDAAGHRYFFEIKQKKTNTIRKYRAVVEHRNLEALFNAPEQAFDGTERFKPDENYRLFIKTAQSHDARPKILTQYMRKAYVSDIDRYARVTFDMNLRYCQREEFSADFIENRMIRYDNGNLFDEGCNVILELKCYTTEVPLWMVDLIRAFDLRRRGFSKYVTGVCEALELYKPDDYGRASAVSF